MSNKLVKHQELKELSKFLSEYSTSLMAVGVQTSRIVRNTARIAESFGFLCDMTIFQKTIIMTLRDADNSHSYSTVNKICLLYTSDAADD